MSSTNLFKISNFRIQYKDSKTLELMTTGASIPGFSLGDLVIPRNVVTDKRPGDTLVYDDLIITALCDEELKAYKEVYDYIVLAANPINGKLTIDQPVFDATLFLTTNKNNIQHKINFYNCYFKGINSVELTSNTTEEEHFTITIMIGYTHFLFE